MGNRGRLTKREELFAWLCVVRGNATRARLDAGFADLGSAETNAHEAYRLGQKPHIREKVSQISDQYLTQLGVSFEQLLLEAVSISRSNLRDGFDPSGNLLPPQEWPADFARAVQGYRERVVKVSTKKRTTTTVVMREVKLHGKWQALERMIEAAAIARRAAGGKQRQVEDLRTEDLEARIRG